MERISLKQTSAYTKVIEIPEELEQFGKSAYAYADKMINTSWFSKANADILQNARIKFKRVLAIDPYNLCWQLEKANRLGYVLYLDRDYFDCTQENSGSKILILGITGEFKDELLITLVEQQENYKNEENNR